MAEKILKTRIQLKYDTLANWQAVASTFIPKKGEVCIAEVDNLSVATLADAPVEQSRYDSLIKVGDGSTPWGGLKWLSAQAADVYAWAKAATKPTYTANEVGADAKGTASNLINALDFTDTAVGGKYIASVSQTNGKITVTRADLPSFSLPKASDTVSGGIKTGYATSGKNYAVKVDADGDAYVNVPWTDNNTTYTAANGIKIESNVIKHTNAITAGTVSEGGAARTLAHGGTFKVPSITYDAQGHITGTATTTLTLPAAPAAPGNGALTIKVGANGDTSGTGSFTANQSGASTITLPVYTKTEVDAKVAGATQYLGTVANASALTALTPSKGDFCRVSTAFNGYHPSDMLICETPKNGSTAATWSVVHGEIDANTWVANSKNAAGYVAAGGSNANKVWKTDANGNPAWRDDANTVYSHPAGSAASKASGLYKFSTDANSHISAVTPITKADITALGIPGQDTNTTYVAGDGIDIDSDNIISIPTNYVTNGKNYAVKLDLDSNSLYVNVPWTNTVYTLPAATSSALGGIKIGYTQSGKNYPVVLDSNNKAYVNVPWTDTNTDTHYQAKNIVGASATAKANAAVTGNGVYLNLVENDTIRSTHKITGAGTAKVTSDASGNITITAADQYRGTVTSVSAGAGLKVTGTASTTPKVEIDDATVFVFDCGNASTNV